jgi:hypothetical protein
MSRMLVVRTLILLILAELVSSLILIPMNLQMAASAAALFLGFSYVYYLMYCSRRYV